MPLPAFTIQTFNQTALQPAGAVIVQRVESVSLGRSFFAGLGGAAGGRNTMMEKKMNDLTKVLLEELDLQAKKQFPTAVALVNLNVHFSEIGKSDAGVFLTGQATATAIIKRNKPAGSTISTNPEASQALASQPLASQPAAQPLASQQLASQPLASQPAAQPVSSNPQVLSGPPLPKPNMGGPRVALPPKMGGRKSKSRKNRM